MSKCVTRKDGGKAWGRKEEKKKKREEDEKKRRMCFSFETRRGRTGGKKGEGEKKGGKKGEGRIISFKWVVDSHPRS